ncbi:hypothetical protein Pfo_023404 [Paulownia fortunei]|nr:hypothetical protein Pfo_023404 [Paulownia fortunei]
MVEKRQLDFSAPLLSVRRFSSPSNSSELVKRKVIEKLQPNRQQSLPLNKSIWEYEEVTKPASVPFHWEQIPGRPRCEVESQVHTPEEPSSTPRLPPGRLSGSITCNCNSCETPRVQGRVAGPLRYNSGERSNDQNIYRPQVEAFCFGDHASLLEKLRESLNCKDESDTESDDDCYSNALDTLSRTESWSLDYSVSGLSGYQSSGVKPSGTFSINKHTRDFMMNRFLPAAKAVVLERPKYVVKKPRVVNELPKPVKKMVSGEINPLLVHSSSDTLPYYSQYTDVGSEDEEQKYPVPKKKPGKAWGIIPRFCANNSLCLLNTLPRMKLKLHTPTSSAGEARKLTRKAHSGPLDKNACHVPHKRKSHSGMLSWDLPEIKNKLTGDFNQFMNSHVTYESGVSSLRRYRSRSISPYRNESPKSPFLDGVGFLGVPKELENYNDNRIAFSRKLFKALQDVSRNQLNERGSGPMGDAVKKTMFTDFLNKTDIPISKSCRRKAEGLVDLSVERLNLLSDRRKMEDKHAVKSCDQDTSRLNILEEGKKLSPKSGSTDKVQPSTCISKLGYVANEMDDIKLNQSFIQESGHLECIEVVPSDIKFGMEDGNNLESDDQRECDPASFKSPLTPPLPKSPSESWLWRTMPFISLGNPFSHSLSRKQVQKGSTTDAEWETIVKSSNLRNDHVRYSEELIPHASQRQNKS